MAWQQAIAIALALAILVLALVSYLVNFLKALPSWIDRDHDFNYLYGATSQI